MAPPRTHAIKPARAGGLYVGVPGFAVFEGHTAQSRSALRLHALLLIGALATFLLWHIGQLAEAEGLHRRFKATTRVARELSIITLAKLLCVLQVLPLTDSAIQVLNERLGIRI